MWNVDLEMAEGHPNSLSSKHVRHETLGMFLDLPKPQFAQAGNKGAVVAAHSSQAVVRIEGDGV